MTPCTLQLTPAHTVSLSLNGDAPIEVAFVGMPGLPGIQGAKGDPGAPASYSNLAPAHLGAQSAGVLAEASRADHVHTMPNAVEVGAEPSGSVASHAAAINPHPQYLSLADAALVFAPLTHTHVIADVAGLQAELDGINNTLTGISDALITINGVAP